MKKCSIVLDNLEMLVFHERDENGNVLIELLDDMGHKKAETREHFSELRTITSIVTE